MRKLIVLGLLAALAVGCESGNPVGPTRPVAGGTTSSTTTTSVPASRRFVAFQAPPNVPNDLTLFFRQISGGASTMSSLLSLVPFSGVHAVAVTYAVTGVYGTASGRGGTVEGEFTGDSLENGTFTGRLIAPQPSGCTAEREFSGPVTGQLLQWTGGRTLRDCAGSPLAFNSLTLLRSDLPPPTTAPTTSVSSTTSTTTTIPTTTTAPQCSYNLSPTSLLMSDAGGDSTVELRTGAGCAWSAQTYVDWIVIDPPREGTGPATVRFFVRANTGPLRTGTIVVGGVPFVVTQSGPTSTTSTTSTTGPCTFSVTPLTVTHPQSGGAGTINFTVGAPTCAWTSSSNVSWIRITSVASGNGTGSISYVVDANDSTSTRTGVVTVAGQNVTVTQPGCTLTVNPLSASIPVTGGTGSIAVSSAGGSCSWTATSGAAWARITGGASGAGSGTVSYAVDPNTSASSRQGTLSVAGQTVTLTQAGCTFTIEPSSAQVPAPGGGGRLTITAAASTCPWTATADSWIQFSPTSGTGSGTVSFDVGQNPTSATREGAIAVGGQKVPVTQASCGFSVSPTTVDVSANGGRFLAIAIGANAACSWTASSTNPWLRITPQTPASGTGPGKLSFDADPNTGAVSRTGTITVAGESVTVNQPCCADTSIGTGRRPRVQ